MDKPQVWAQKIAHVFFGAADGLILNRWSHDTLVLSLAEDRYGGDRYGLYGGLMGFNMIYPLVNIQKTMERSTIFNGKINYFYGHFQ